VKSYVPIIVSVVLVVGAFAAIYVSSRSMQSPEELLSLEIDEEIEKAQRMLNAHEPAGERLLAAVEAATTQPLEMLPEEKWTDHLDYEAFQERMSRQGRRLQTLTQDMSRLRGEAGPPGGAIEDWSQLKEDLEANQRLIDDALAIVSRAVMKTREAGETVVRGTSHAAATRLEAVLLYRKAELLRHRAALAHAEADEHRERAAQLRATWRESQTILEAIGTDDGTGGGGDRGAVGRAPASGPAAMPAVKAQSAPASGGKRSWLGRLGSAVFGRKAAGGETAPGAGAAGDKQAEPRPAGAKEVEGPRGPTLAERLEELEGKRAEAAGQIEQTRAEVSRLKEEDSQLERKLADAQAAADQAQRRMLALETGKLDSSDPAAYDRFKADYEEASKSYREASREISTLAGGAVRRAWPATAVSEEVPAVREAAATQPEGPVGREAEPRRGLIAAVKGSLWVAESRLAGWEQVAATVDARMDEIRKKQEALAEQVAALNASHGALRQEAERVARAAVSAAAKAESFENEAVGVVSEAGPRAAQNARQAASSRISLAQSRKDPESSNPRLDLITKGRFLVGHAQILGADFEYLRAQILHQRADALGRQQRMLEELEEMGVRLDGETQPGTAPAEGEEAQARPEHWLKPAAAEKAAEEARSQAVDAAKAALTQYEEAEEELNRLWVVHANRAAVNYLLANLHRGPEAEKYRKDAIRLYQQSIQERRDRPEAEPYRDILDGLTQTSP